MFPSVRAMAAACVFLGACTAKAEQAFIWWEGEKPKETNFPSGSWFLPGNDAERDKLSGGQWLSNDKESKEALFAAYEVTVPKAGTYDFWVRKFWHHGPFRWRFGDQPWQTCGRDCTLADNVTLRTHVGANWVPLGQVKLAEGKHLLRIELLESKGASAFDCFVLTEGAFLPRGKLKPGEKYGTAPDGWFAFEPDADPFAPAALDLRGLNHKTAGEKGFLQSKEMDFAFEQDPAPVKFWAVNASPMACNELDVYLAKRLAKLGVNMVRMHGAVFDRDASDPAAINRKYLDRIHHFVSALKNEGIYVNLSFYFPLWFEVKPNYGIAGYENLQNKKAFTLLFFHPRMQEIYKSWARGLLLTPNPYTGLPLAKDPAVGIVEIINEDNYFFWTTTPYQNISADATHMLEERFGRWVAKKYGSIEKATAAWGKGQVKGDDPAAGRVGLYAPWFYKDEAGSQRNPKRICDQAQFLTEDLRGFYEDMHAWFRKDLGVRCPLIAANWITADERILGALDKYANAACETLDRHAYFGGPHKGEGASYSVRTGHQYQDRCALLEPEAAPVRELQYAGHTHTVTEYNWPMPNRFRTDSVLLAAAYGAMQGTDAYFHFATGSADWESVTNKWSIHIPSIMGQFPATAMIYRKGYVKEAPVVVHDAAKLADLYELKGSPISQPQNLDDLRKADIPKGASGEVQALASIDPLAFCVGKVTRTVAADPGKGLVQDLSAYIDRDRKTIKSMTGELLWDYGLGLLKVNTPCAQGATGFLQKTGAIRLDDVDIQSGSEYGTAIVVSLDGKPIKTSQKLLVQVMTEDMTYGWKVRAAQVEDNKKLVPGSEIADLGGPPIVVRKLAGTMAVRRPDAASLKVIALDGHGYAKKELPAGGKDAVRIDLLPDCLYYVIQKSN